MTNERVAHSSARLGRGKSQKISAFQITIKPDYDRLVKQLQTFRFPTLYTLDDLLPLCGLSTRADRVHLSRALRRAGIIPLRNRKIALTDIVSGKKLRAYVWCVGATSENLQTVRDVRREYYRQHHVDLIAQAQNVARRHA